MERTSPNLTERPATDDSHWLELVCQHVHTIRFGVVQIVVHDSRVVQIEKTERVRLDQPRAQQSEADQNTGGDEHHENSTSH
jgi:hypothetical protein